MTLSPFTSLVVAFGAGAIIAAIVIPLIIGWQRRLAVGQQIYEDGPASHVDKAGTPTMGGIAFALAAITGALIALAAWASTQRVYSAQWFGGFVVLPQWLWWFLSICAIVGTANAVNLTDGL